MHNFHGKVEGCTAMNKTILYICVTLFINFDIIWQVSISIRHFSEHYNTKYIYYWGSCTRLVIISLNLNISQFLSILVLENSIKCQNKFGLQRVKYLKGPWIILFWIDAPYGCISLFIKHYMKMRTWRLTKVGVWKGYLFSMKVFKRGTIPTIQ